ncbi:exodeoxyribonuclease I [Yersinia ruckeri]|uniref:exodeoxyribonuclease I n=1 Tax=Yersinia ruckeri TaxID=29486 RepID=UPI0011A4AF4D|nr:exodeoxyribonuclease I [Yersinia ruckeri]EKN3346787.1 exodeoxyribonuclease I [Yersinia ruckeri]EKN3362048.1 exodeoxyribonuclease I [Yersinia ruckeri]EKN4201572.1 exodeoxyribonuclease I [Yersinia ruckeri]EKN4209249.1 exodeoxyribonuclease I [Yersinia ruckeri]EKN4704920.1 exodeoxyribonuclease I [Yersinia ruckeri]
MSKSASSPTFYVHDYETFGQHPALDRPAQFAGVRTDLDFNIIEEPLVVYCSPADDYLPQPEAVMITGITPQTALAKGINEAEFSQQIHQAFSVAGTCILGYNNIRFDDEVSRNIFYRNFYDPYAYSWQNGNSRWDLLDVMRACYALRPEGIIWPENDDGLPSFKLEHLTKANGVEHLQAHDAMSDVHATIALAKLVKQAQPRLFDYLYQHRSKHKISALIDIAEMTPLVHVSGMFGAARGNTSWVAPLAWHPENKNAVIMCDLAGDMSPLLELDAETLRERLYTRRDKLSADQAAVPIKLVHINKCPVLAPAKTLLAENAERLAIDRQRCLQNLQVLRQNPQIREKVVTLFAESPPFAASSDVDAQLYDGFFGDADRATMKIIQQTAPQNLPALDLSFQDPRLTELLFRFRARNYPNTLDDSEQRRWQNHRREMLSPERVQEYVQQLEQFYNLYESDKEKLALLKDLYDYARELVS